MTALKKYVYLGFLCIQNLNELLGISVQQPTCIYNVQVFLLTLARSAQHRKQQSRLGNQLTLMPFIFGWVSISLFSRITNGLR